ncbi:PfkB family carbohydrate kinase [Myxacorys almedinensis]|uniref:Sugar kinase n=1 Tax=Myxacorys almedinensis A TaxID=2690445 RepID=A0A8J7YYF9_9CYAN|nr:PfkB family carbohydrate kinase [Myxacorys almedinensis]NDJ16844.1 sugar kinase [Myxacorys almedinensis A]
MSKGLFVGMVTLDLIYLVEQLPNRNQKIVAIDALTSAGGPATNAAVAFQHLENQVVVMGAIGTHPTAHLIVTELQEWGVAIADLAPTRTESPPVSSILVTRSTGERAVVSINAVKFQIGREQIPPNVLAGVDVVLVDGHQMEIGAAIAKQASGGSAKQASGGSAQSAQDQKIPVVMDGGSWKPGFETVLPWVDYAICSANFYPPGCKTTQEVMNYLSKFGIEHIAVTNGGDAIALLSHGESGSIQVPHVPIIDTLGAGDIFHGAFCHFILQTNFKQALVQSAQIAARACQFFGTRQWMRPTSV